MSLHILRITFTLIYYAFMFHHKSQTHKNKNLWVFSSLWFCFALSTVCQTQWSYIKNITAEFDNCLRFSRQESISFFSSLSLSLFISLSLSVHWKNFAASKHDIAWHRESYIYIGIYMSVCIFFFTFNEYIWPAFTTMCRILR